MGFGGIRLVTLLIDNQTLPPLCDYSDSVSVFFTNHLFIIKFTPGLRRSPVFVGQATMREDIVHYIAPHSADLAQLLA